MSISAICQPDVITIDVGASLRDAASLMRAHHIGALVVTVDAAGREQAVGVITDRDLAIEILARDLNPTDVKVGQLASRHLASVPGTAGIAEAVAVMQASGVRRLLVTDHEGQLAGFVSADDLLEALAGQLGVLANALRQVSRARVLTGPRFRARGHAPSSCPAARPACSSRSARDEHADQTGLGRDGCSASAAGAWRRYQEPAPAWPP